ncbi:cytochrome C oxidase subunit I [Burkholderia pseudomallei]|uniref:cytochrome C oxidase subunit I n=1 Tax=Burkholderia pseudomallei TaxID=28450 RepID=UPI00358DEEFD
MMRSRTNGAIDTPRARRAQHRLLWACMLAGLVGAPALWMSQTLVSETLSSVACDPLDAANREPNAPGEPDELGELDELGEPDVPDEPDDAASKTRFIAVCGLLAGVGFALGLIFTGLAVIFVEPCHPWR